MIMTNKILAVALITALVGASLGAAIMHSRDSSPVADTTSSMPNDSNATTANYSNATYNKSAQPSQVPEQFRTSEEQTAYKVGFSDGFQACAEKQNVYGVNSGVTYRSARYGTRYGTTSQRRVYYDYSTSHGRTFWQKHRDKLTMAIGTGAGALIGGLVGGKKGAGIGALAGLGGSALYTYKLRHRHHRY
jgi:hypothetical protein